MISKNELKYIQSLYHKKARDKEKLFIVEGPKMVQELLESPFTVQKVWTTQQKWLKTFPKAPIELIDEQHLAKASHLSTANEILAIAQMAEHKNPPRPAVGSFILALDGIRDPGNMGTIIRMADWFGVDRIVASPDSADIYNPKVVQSTMGSIFRTSVYYAPLEAYLANNPLTVYGALLSGEPLGSFPISVPVKEGIIVIGNESKGIRQEILPFVTQAVKIPAFGKAESLNAAMATAVLLGHFKIPSFQK
ncbi:RNA methyltransferase, TrmH family [Arachidicoccus rhizosphaerae]|uniref:RNA methyltransferase, TrmH family n=1 Tax=Arachidicoccus rhizosphaerae TaxID=551991 RepID=A0A1H3YKQ6_9BACT|nr:RNA methyltransferase [Arachidicoccus rhizosphaerae]SEA12126.1 RNA methyltransferase, TrmH family [Arachidicoccus rhizosphaerae]